MVNGVEGRASGGSTFEQIPMKGQQLEIGFRGVSNKVGI